MEAINDHCIDYNSCLNNSSTEGSYTVGFIKCWQMLPDCLTLLQMWIQAQFCL